MVGPGLRTTAIAIAIDIVKRVLMIAFHFPPLAGSSGIQRTLRFAQHLPEFGWEPIVLTAHPRAYERTSPDLMSDIPEGLIVERAFALDTARHLAVRGRYLGMLARPDRWIGWKLGAVPAGMRLIRRYRPAAIWSTYPIATAHAIAGEIWRKARLPWVADFRDPMVQEGYPPDPKVRKSFEQIEGFTLAHASSIVFTTPGAARDYRLRYPAASSRIVEIQNGYDESSFLDIQVPAGTAAGHGARPLLLLHSGVVYPSERDPTHLFEALGTLVAAGKIRQGDLLVRFRAAGHDAMLVELTGRHHLQGVVEVLPPIPYREALAEMLSADGLLLMQASNCNAQIPAKLYEYLRADKPILVLTDPAGDTATVVKEAGIDSVIRLDSTSEIAAALPNFLRAVRENRGARPDPAFVAKASRRGRTEALAALLEKATS